MLASITYFFSRRIWDVRLSDLGKEKRLPFNYFRIFILAVHGFLRDKCALRASALTYYSLLSVVPVVALVFGIAKGFGLQRLIQTRILDLAQQANWPPEVAERIISFSHALLAKTKGGLVAGIGFLALVWAVLSIMGSIEDAFNDIWAVKKGRAFIRKVTDYLTVVILSPIFLVISSSATIVIAGQTAVVMKKIALLGAVSPLIVFLLKLLPYVAIWFILVLNYMILPNTKVPFKSALIAGIVTGTIYQAVQWVYIKFQVGIAHYGAVYGSFAALPLFVTWLQVSWMVVLYGAEIAVAHENQETFGLHPDYRRLTIGERKKHLLTIWDLLASRFLEGEKPLNTREISTAVEIPVRLAQQTIDEMLSAGILTETSRDGDRSVAYQPARDVEQMPHGLVVEMWEARGRTG